MTEPDKNVRKPSPTYLSAPRLEKVFELISTRTLNEVSTSYFEQYGFGGSDAALAMGTLKFLGVLDENGKATEKMRSLQLRGEPRQKALQEILKVAYADLFKTMPEPFNLTSDELINEFMHHYRLSPRVGKPAAVAFLKLSEFAGWKEPTTATPRKREGVASAPRAAAPRGEKQNKAKETDTPMIPGDVASVKLAEGKVVLYLPQEVMNRAVLEDDLGEEFRGIMKSLKAFCEKYIPATPTTETPKE
ncbi:MAG: hypothetical protein ABA06_02890 [Parcubacteria bacterium C7867-001]|nr:MAG: hypothetical protein ABA06_02890 [Parcubacteria bacterium C7867-001]